MNNQLFVTHLKNITGVDKICLRSKTLTRLFGDLGCLNELVVEDAPSLEELVGVALPRGKAKVKIVTAPKLQVLGCLGKSVRPLVLRDTVLDGGIFMLRSIMHSVNTLDIQVPFSEKGCIDFVTRLLKCFPCIQTLYVEPDWLLIPHAKQWDIETSIQCVEHSIKKLVFGLWIL